MSTESGDLKLRLKQANDEITKQKIELSEISQKSKATHDKVIEIHETEVLELKSENERLKAKPSEEINKVKEEL